MNKKVRKLSISTPINPHIYFTTYKYYFDKIELHYLEVIIDNIDL